MSDLLESMSFDELLPRRVSGSPRLLEFEVNPELAPYLVSSQTSVVWVSRASTSSRIRAAVRKRQNIERDMIVAVAEMGPQLEWGNVHSLSTEGIAACVEHLRYYGLADVELLLAADTDFEGIAFPEDVPRREVDWLPQDAVVAVPGDRSFLGTIGVIGQHKGVAVMHNPSRGVAVAWR